MHVSEGGQWKRRSHDKQDFKTDCLASANVKKMSKAHGKEPESATLIAVRMSLVTYL